MTKSTRHKRARKENVKKLKLKLGKRLKRSANETKTDFKARKIVVKEQLAVKSKLSMMTKKSLTVPDLLSRISHHSVFMRQEGLNGLKELVLKYSKTELGPHLSEIFTKLNPCLVDEDHQVRLSSISVIEALLLKTGNLIQPYFKMVTSYLSCAMVHLNTGVQTDSLELMEVLLNHAASLTAQSANIILKNFFLLISRKIDTKSKNNIEGDSYILISNPSSRLASIKWRVKLLKSLGRYLDSILSERNKLEATIPVSLWQVITLGCFPSLVKEDSSRNSIQGIKLLIDETEVKSFAEKILPLLLQAWQEVGYNFSQQKISSGTALDPIAIEMLKCILDIILHLWSLTERVTGDSPTECIWFMNKLGEKFVHELLVGFPYCALEKFDDNDKNATSKAPVDSKATCHYLNINLASLDLRYRNKSLIAKKTTAQYYIDFLSNYSQDEKLGLSQVASSGSSLLKSSNDLPFEIAEELLNASLQCYKRIKDKSRKALLQFPLQTCDLTCSYLWKSPVMAEWISVVVENSILDPSDESHLKLVLQFKLRNTPGFAQISSKYKDALKETLESGNYGLDLATLS